MDSLKKKEIFQAVVVADNFNENFNPITNDIPIALLPLVNVALIDYTLESLNRSGIEEVYVFSSRFSEQIKNYIKNQIESKCAWSVGMTVDCIASERCCSFGDALRDLDSKGFLKSNFILMGADTVSNAQLKPILEKHKKNLQFDKNTAMTVVYKQTATTDNRENHDLVIGVDKDSGRLLFHERKHNRSKGDQISLPMEIFFTNPEIVIRNDIIDPQIAICSTSVLPLFSDNFDFGTRDDFIRGLLINEEILGSTLYVHFLPSQQYAAKVFNWKSYQIISNDVLNRWAYPLVPDMGICRLKQNYIFLRNFVYKNKDVHLARSTELKENVAIYENCTVSDQTKISYSILGKGCSVGKNCVLNQAYIFDNIKIEDNCNLNNCIISNNAIIKKNSNISEGAVIGSSVIIPENSVITKSIVISTKPEKHIKFHKISDHAFVIDEDNDLDDSDNEEDYKKHRNHIYNADADASSEYTSSSDGRSSRSNSPAIADDDGTIFLNEVIDSLTRGFEEKSNPDFLILEINSSRYAYNMTVDEVNYYTVKAVLEISMRIQENSNVLAAFNKVFIQLESILRKYIRDDSAMMDCLKAIEDTCNEYEIYRSKLPQLIHYLYDKEIITENVIISWFEEIEDEKSFWIKTSLTKLIEWLQQSSEEESEEE